MKYIKLRNKGKNTVKTLLKKNDISTRSINKLLKDGLYVNENIYKKSINLTNNDIVKIPIEDENLDYKPIKKDIKILYEDENILVISKPSNLTVNSKNQVNLSNFIANYFLENKIKSKIRLINRLDMDTSGLMMVAKNKYAQAYYQKLMEKGKIDKKYLAFVGPGLDIDKEVSIRLAYDDKKKLYKQSTRGKKASTYFKTIKKTDSYSIIDCKLITGKTHQIRATLSFLSYPILGDRLYGSKLSLNRFLLHSYYLSFETFLKKESIILRDLPDFKPFLSNL